MRATKELGDAVAVKQYFNMTLEEMRREYMPLSPELKKWFGDGCRAELAKQNP